MATRKWIKIGAGAAAGVSTIVGLFTLLVFLYGFQITDLTGDIVCRGTPQDPCISEFNVKNPNPFMVDIYSKDNVKVEFSPQIKDYALFVPDGRCSATGACACELKDGSKVGFKGWRCTDFTNKTKPVKDKEYNFRFPAYSTTKFRLVGFKNNPTDTVKWTFGAGRGELDPYWNGSAIINDPTLVLDLPLDQSTNLTDRSIYNNAITQVNGVHTSEAYNDWGYALNSPTEGDWINVSTVIINWTNPFTISLWINPTGAGDTDQEIFESLSGNTGIRIQYDNIATGRIETFMGNGATTIRPTCAAAGCAPPNQWTNVVLTYNGTTGQLYTNATLKDTDAVAVISQTGGHYLGRLLSSGTTENYNGSIDEVKIWNRSLSSSEISQLFYCLPRNSVDWNIANTNCVVVNENWIIGSGAKNIILSNNYNLTLINSNLTFNDTIINSGSRLEKDSTSQLIVK